MPAPAPGPDDLIIEGIVAVIAPEAGRDSTELVLHAATATWLLLTAVKMYVRHWVHATDKLGHELCPGAWHAVSLCTLLSAYLRSGMWT